MRRLLCVIVCASLAACGGWYRVPIKVTGTVGSVTTGGAEHPHVELIALQNDTLYCVGDRLVEIPVGEISQVSLSIERSLGWTVPMILTQALPFGVYLSTTRQADGGTTVVLAGILGVTMVSMITTTPQATFVPPWTQESIRKIRERTRHPYGLTATQLDRLRQEYAAEKEGEE